MVKKIFLVVLMMAFPAMIMAEDTSYMVNYTKAGVTAEITINGMPFCTYSKGDFSGAENINMWIMPGKNTITVKISAKKAETINNHLSIALSLQAPWSFDSAKPKILEIEIPQIKDPAADPDVRLPLVVPFAKTYEFTPVSVPPLKLWGEASVLVLDAKTIAEAKALVNQLYAVLDKRDGSAYLDLNMYAVLENTIALGYDPKTYVESARKSFGTLFKEKEFVFKKPKPADLAYKLIAQNKVIMVCTKNGKPSLDIGIITKDIFLARINGKLTIVR